MSVMLRVVVAAAVALVVLGAPARGSADEPTRDDPTRNDPTRIEGQARLGLEYDDNPLRRQVDDPRGLGGQADWLVRYFGTLESRFDAPPRGRLHLGLRHGGKIFTDVSEADALLTQIEAGYRRGLGEHLAAGLSAEVKDRTERTSRLDYNRGGARLLVQGLWRPWSARASAGWRYFVYKPDTRLSSQGPQFTGGARRYLSRHLLVDASYGLTLRRFDGVDGADPRRDWLHLGRLGVGYHARIILDAAYELVVNESTFEEQDLVRHGLELTTTLPLWWEVLASAKLAIQRTEVAQDATTDALFVVDEDNRNIVIVSLARPLWERWEIEARYSLYVEDFTQSSTEDGQRVERDYRRQTLLLGVGYAFD